MGTESTETGKEYVRIEEAAMMFGVSRTTMYEWINKYKIRRYKSGKMLMIKPADVREARAKAAEPRPVDDQDEE